MKRMKPFVLRLALILGAMCFVCPSPPKRYESSPIDLLQWAQEVLSNRQNTSESDEKMFSTFFIEGDSLSYNDYQVVKLVKSVDDFDIKDIPVTYALLKRNATVVGSFLTGHTSYPMSPE